jgi:HAD superfamily hydrolase (TIGR01490 family)
MSLNFGRKAGKVLPVLHSFPETPPQGIALFDLDGTLIAWDCQLLFRHFILKREAWRGIFLPLFLLALPLTGLLGAGGMKRIFLCYLWKMDAGTLAGYSKEFAKTLMPQIYPELRARLEAHRQKGHLLILSSASPEIYVAEIGREIGFDVALGTQVEFVSFFPDLVNHKGAAKVERLHQLLPASYFKDGKLCHCHGYTDSTADLPMLALCDEVTVVNPSPALTALAARCAWEVVRPQRPWHSKLDHALQSLALLFGMGKNSR